MPNAAELAMIRQLNSNVDSFEDFFEDESADAPPIVSAQSISKSKLGAVRGNPVFSAQFDLSMFLQYYTVVTATGVYTQIAAAGLSAALKNKLPVYVFGNSDYAAGFANLRKAFPLTSWTHGTPFMYGVDPFQNGAALDATVTGNLVLGDLVIPFTSALPGAGTTTVALAVVRCTQVAYATLLDALNSDRFGMNMIRYVIPDTTKIAQYANNIGMFKQSLFGKFDGDYTSPNSFKKPEQQQNGLIDVPLKFGVDKQKALGMYINYDCIELSWSIFVVTTRKVTA
ncbi:MAG: hypothetical protein WC389_05410 [Lutibacter sp.]|jgi:hypothetical protein